MPPTATITVVGWWAVAVIQACIINAQGLLSDLRLQQLVSLITSTSLGEKMLIRAEEFDWNENTSSSKWNKSLSLDDSGLGRPNSGVCISQWENFHTTATLLKMLFCVARLKFQIIVPTAKKARNYILRELIVKTGSQASNRANCKEIKVKLVPNYNPISVKFWDAPP